VLAVVLVALCTVPAVAHGVAACDVYADSRAQPDVERVASEDPQVAYDVQQVDSEYTARGSFGGVGHRRARINAVLDNGYSWNCSTGRFEQPPPPTAPTTTTVATTTTVPVPPSTVRTTMTAPATILPGQTQTTTTLPPATTTASSATTRSTTTTTVSLVDGLASAPQTDSGDRSIVPLLIAPPLMLGIAYLAMRLLRRRSRDA
jgi:hypothetical protein